MSPPDHRAARWLAFTLFLVYLLTYSGLAYAVDEQSALTVTESILRDGLTVDGFTVNQMEWNQRDVPPQNIGGVNGDLYSKKSLGIALLGVPLFALGQWLARAGVEVGPVQTVLLTNAFVTALTAYVFFLLVRALGYTRRTAIIGTLALSLGTPLWPYAKTFFSEPLGALGLCLTLLGAVKFRRPQEPLPSPPPLRQAQGPGRELSLRRRSDWMLPKIVGLLVLWSHNPLSIQTLPHHLRRISPSPPRGEAGRGSFSAPASPSPSSPNPPTA